MYDFVKCVCMILIQYRGIELSCCRFSVNVTGMHI